MRAPMAVTVRSDHGWGGQMSMVFGVLFACVAAGCATWRHEVRVESGRRRLVVRRGIAGATVERAIGFDRMTCVRVTLLRPSWTLTES